MISWVLCVKTGFGILLLERKVSRQSAHLTDAQHFCFSRCFVVLSVCSFRCALFNIIYTIYIWWLVLWGKTCLGFFADIICPTNLHAVWIIRNAKCANVKQNLCFQMTGETMSEQQTIVKTVILTWDLLLHF